jgi:hypothetical protein
VRIAALAPGTYTAAARTAELASAESAPVRVSQDGEAQVALALQPGTRLAVRLEDARGAPLPGWVEVYDAEEREVGGLYPYGALEELYYQGAFSPTAPRFGPLAPGRHRIEARFFGGGRASREIALDGRPELAVTLSPER